MWPFKKRKLKTYLIDNKYKIILAFERDGKKYFQFENAFEMSTGRGLQALTIFEEFGMRCTRDYLEKHIKAVDILLNSQKIQLSVIAELNANLRDRLNLAADSGMIYKLASVLFFDETESPYAYDGAYNAKKIAAWRADPEMLPFLVSVPLKTLLPFTDTAKENIKTYLTVADAMNEMHNGRISDVLSRLQ